MALIRIFSSVQGGRVLFDSKGFWVVDETMIKAVNYFENIIKEESGIEKTSFLTLRN